MTALPSNEASRFSSVRATQLGGRQTRGLAAESSPGRLPNGEVCLDTTPASERGQLPTSTFSERIMYYDLRIPEVIHPLPKG